MTTLLLRPRVWNLLVIVLVAIVFVIGSSGLSVAKAAGLTVSPSSIAFGNQTVGASSAPVTVTITSNVNREDIRAVGIQNPFIVNGFAGTVTLTSGQQTTLTVVFTPTTAGAVSATLGIFHDAPTPILVSLTGTGTAVSSLTITTPSPLPAATQNAAYSALFSASGGTSPYFFSVSQGSSLPAGLSLSTSGLISGSANTTSTGNFSFGIQVTDSGTPSMQASTTFTLPVGAATGANCNQISFGSPPFVPINDLGTGTYLGAEGGLYPNGSNVDPSDHQTAGANIAAGIQPLDSNGNPSATGKYVLLAIGASNTRDEFQQFGWDVLSDPTTNSHLVLVNAGEAGFGLLSIATSTSKFWTNIETLLTAANVTDKQIVAAWIEMSEAGPPAKQPPLQFASQVQAKFETIAQILTSKYANIKLFYFTTRMYGGYANTSQSPEPFAYATGFAAKDAIQDQLNGSPSLNFDPTKGTVMAPWMAWAAYWWANGLSPRSDGTVWTCQDFASDGTHPTIAGRMKAAASLLSFFKTDTTTTPWFLAH